MSALAALAVLWLAPLGAHPNSSSTSLVRVERGEVTVELVCQTLAVLEALPLDLDGDRRLSGAELAAGRGELAAYFLERYAVRVGTEGEAGGGTSVPGELLAVSAALDGEPPFAEERVTCELRFAHPEGPGGRFDELLIRVRLFQEQNPFHFDVCQLRWEGGEPQTFLFGIDGEAWWVQSAARRRPRVLASFFRLGVDHIVTGYDHLAFLAALLLAARALGSLVGIVTAFTAAHSVSLAAAALGWVRLPGSLVELAIAMSIAYVGALNLLVREPSSRWVEAFVFGLVHGLGFAGFLSEALGTEPQVLTALVGFNLGVEAGQLAAVVLAASVVAFLPGDRRGCGRDGQPLAGAWLAPRWLRRVGSAAVLASGSYWFLERAGWWPFGGWIGGGA